MTDNVIVIGGGPAGASAALGFLRAGFGVTLLEQRSQWQGRVCGAFLDAEAVRHLRWLNVFDELVAAGAMPVPTSVLTTAQGNIARLSSEEAGETGWGLPRQRLEEILLNAVVRHGGLVKTGTRMLSYRKDGSEWIAAARDANGLTEFQGNHLVLTDGRFSALAGKPPKKRGGWFGWNATFENVSQEPGEMSIHFYPGGYVGVLTFRDGTTNVCGLRHRGPDDSDGWDNVFTDAVKRQPCLRELMDGARRISEWRGVGPLPFGRKAFDMNGPILAGDAAAVGDPFMGEGIGRALGAGPIIFQALQFPKARASYEIFHREYARFWRKSYASRFKMGFWMRRVIDPLPFFGSTLDFLVKKPALLRRVTPLLHRGFTSRA